MGKILLFNLTKLKFKIWRVTFFKKKKKKRKKKEKKIYVMDFRFSRNNGFIMCICI